MSRSKKNWDHLVDSLGNYSIEVGPDGSIIGDFVGSKGEKGDKGQQGGSGFDGDKGDTGSIGQQGVKGKEGDEGPKGEVGDKGERFTFDDLTDAEKLQITGADGDKGDKGDDGTEGPDGKSAFELAQNAGFVGTEAEWLVSLNGSDGDKGQSGEKGDTGDEGSKGEVGDKGDEGEKGDEGPAGADATSFLHFKGELDTSAELNGIADSIFGDVYYITEESAFYGYDAEGNWVEIGTGSRIKGETGAKGEKGNKGEIGDKGDDGISAYEVAVDNGFVGNEAAWLESLKGENGEDGDKGDQGKSAYQSYVDTTADSPVKTEFAWQLSLKGEDGVKGDKLTFNDLTATEKESLKGATGDKGPQGIKGNEGDEGVKGQKGLEGEIGSDGDSAYDIYLDTTTDDPKLNNTQWLESLKGDKGEFTPANQFYTKGQSDARFVKKAGGDSMEGPLTMQAQDPGDSRATNKIRTLGVYSNSSSSSLRLGTTRDRVYVGHDDVTTNCPFKINASGVAEGGKVLDVTGVRPSGGSGTSILTLLKKTGGDQLRYYGPVTFDKEVTTKEHVDKLIDFTQYGELS